MSTIGWKINRLRSMGAAEVAYRIGNMAQQALEARGYGLVENPPPFEGSSGDAWVESFPVSFGANIEHYLSRANTVLDGQFRVFAMHRADLGFPPDWNMDAKTGTKVPLLFGKTLNYRDKNVVGDIKYLWEPNRHLELVWLAQAWCLSQQSDYLIGVQRLLDSWISQCPYPLGVNWISSLEVAIRLLNWSFAWHLIGGDDSPIFDDAQGVEFRRRWMASVFQHCHFIASHFSKHSSANNHLLGEYTGLFAAATTWPLWKESSRWQSISRHGLETQANEQNTSDGVNREQAIWYQHEVADMMLLAGLIGRANGVEFSDSYWGRLEAMLDYIASVMDLSGNVPMIGDSDDAVMVQFGLQCDVYRSLLATGAVLFQRGDLKHKAVTFDDKSRWLLGDAAAIRFDALDTSIPSALPKRCFPEGGYYILGKNFERENEIRLLADAGSLGFLSIAAHGHADALAFTLSVHGKEMLIDPGTFSYHADPVWRNYFRGTSAHNTVRIDELDQSIAGGSFLWLNHASTTCLNFDNSSEHDVWEAEHDGYCRLGDPVTHRRRVVMDKLNDKIQVVDVLSCQQKHFVELHWHLGENCIVKVENSTVIISDGGTCVVMQMPHCDWDPEIVYGAEKPPLGWVSRAYDVKMPAVTVRWAGYIDSATQLETTIDLPSEVDRGAASPAARKGSL